MAGPYIGSLKKADTINLLDDQGAVFLTVPYSNDYPWPVAAHGTGHSIVLANPTYGEGDPRAWDISDIVGGSPGGPEAYRPSPLRNVVINELLAHSENPAVLQFVELYNHSSQTNDLSGCILTDDPSTNKFVIPAGTLIGPARLRLLQPNPTGVHPRWLRREALFHQARWEPGAGRGPVRGAGRWHVLGPLAGWGG